MHAEAAQAGTDAGGIPCWHLKNVMNETSVGMCAIKTGKKRHSDDAFCCSSGSE